MPASLINPDNRLLGWSIGDMSLYGAALSPAVLPANEAEAQPIADEAGTAAPPTAVSMAGSTEALNTSIPDTDGSQIFALAPVAFTGGAPSAPMTVVQPATSATTSVSPGAPADTGSGSVASAPALGSSLHDIAATLSAPAATLAPTDLPPSLSAPIMSDIAPAAVDAANILSVPVIAAPAAAPIEVADVAVSSINTLTETTTTTLTDTAAVAVDGVEGVVTGASGAVEAATAVIDTAVSDVAAVAASALSDTADVVATLVETAQATVTDAITTVVPAVAEVATTVTAPVADTVNALATDTTGALDSVDATFGNAVGDTSDLLTGPDPSAGVATLVAMVAAADQFDLTHVNIPDVADTGSIVDLLAVDIADDPVIGDVHTPMSHDDDHHGLLGL